MSSTAPPGHLGQLSRHQQDTLDAFRQQLRDENTYVPEKHDDVTLLRFLRAKNFDLSQTKPMWDNYQRWRKDQGVDDLLHFNLPRAPEVMKMYPRYYHKTDKDGRPVYIEQIGYIDVSALYKITNLELLTKHFISQCEQLTHKRLPAASKAVGHSIEASCRITDFKGVGITSVASLLSFIKNFSDITSNYYPGCAGDSYIINAPWGFSTAWRLIRPLMGDDAANVKILGSDYRDELLKQIPRENLPKELGGECQCPGEGRCQMSDAGPWK